MADLEQVKVAGEQAIDRAKRMINNLAQQDSTLALEKECLAELKIPRSGGSFSNNTKLDPYSKGKVKHSILRTGKL